MCDQRGEIVIFCVTVANLRPVLREYYCKISSILLLYIKVDPDVAALDVRDDSDLWVTTCDEGVIKYFGLIYILKGLS